MLSVITAFAVAATLASANPVPEKGLEKRFVYTNEPYTGPAVPVGDWADQTVNGNGKGFPRLNEPPAVWPTSWNATNNINTIALAYVPGGMNVHFSTPYGIGAVPCVYYSTDPSNLSNVAKGATKT